MLDRESTELDGWRIERGLEDGEFADRAGAVAWLSQLEADGRLAPQPDADRA